MIGHFMLIDLCIRCCESTQGQKRYGKYFFDFLLPLNMLTHLIDISKLKRQWRQFIFYEVNYEFEFHLEFVRECHCKDVNKVQSQVQLLSQTSNLPSSLQLLVGFQHQLNCLTAW